MAITPDEVGDALVDAEEARIDALLRSQKPSAKEYPVRVPREALSDPLLARLKARYEATGCWKVNEYGGSAVDHELGFLKLR